MENQNAKSSDTRTYLDARLRRLGASIHELRQAGYPIVSVLAEMSLKPSQHFVRYDAQTYAEQGFLERGGRVGDMASRKPRYWQVSATCRTQDPTTGEQMKHRFIFKSEVRAKLSELSQIINERIHQEEDYLPDCMSVMVVARIMTQDGK